MGPSAIRYAAGQVVVEVQPSGATALRFGQAQHLLRILKEQMVVGTGTVEVKVSSVVGRSRLCLPLRSAADATSGF